MTFSHHWSQFKRVKRFITLLRWWTGRLTWFCWCVILNIQTSEHSSCYAECETTKSKTNVDVYFIPENELVSSVTPPQCSGEFCHLSTLTHVTLAHVQNQVSLPHCSYGKRETESDQSGKFLFLLIYLILRGESLLLTVTTGQLRYWRWKWFVAVRVCLWGFLVAGDECQRMWWWRITDRRLSCLHLSIILPPSFFNSTDELLREKSLVHWRQYWCVCVWTGSSLGYFAV